MAGRNEAETTSHRMSINNLVSQTLTATETGVSIQMTYNTDTVIEAMKTYSLRKTHPRYGNLFGTETVDDTPINDSYHYERIKLKTDTREGGLKWITADKLYVPYNEVLLRECVVKAFEYVLLNKENALDRVRYDRDLNEIIGDRASQFYFDSPYYKTNFLRASEEWSAKCKEIYMVEEPVIIKRCEDAEKRLESAQGRIDDAIFRIDNLLASLPKSVSQTVRSDITSIRAHLHY